MRRRISAFINLIYDPDRDFQERIFILLTVIGTITVFLAMVGDVLSGENIVEIVTLLAAVIISPIMTHFAVRFNKVRIGAFIVASGIVFIIMPVVFYFGGGLTGGSILWFAFAYLYIGLVLVGKARAFLMAILSIFIVYACANAYAYPHLIIGHNRWMWYVDTAISIGGTRAA